jgi:hypothetical protein
VDTTERDETFEQLVEFDLVAQESKDGMVADALCRHF